MRASLLFKIMNVGERATQDTAAQPASSAVERAAVPPSPDRQHPHDLEDQGMLLDLDLNPDLV